jgi:hypothetical protein
VIYVHLSKAFDNYDGNFTCKIARTIEEATQLIEAGFEYICEMDNTKLFKKRK